MGVRRGREHASRAPALPVLLFTSLAALTALVGAAVTPAAGASASWTQGPNLPNSYLTYWDVTYAYFPPMNEVVLFGGTPKQLTEAWSNQTWVYRSGDWSLGPTPPSGLTPRGGAAMAYDPISRNIVMFGGADGSWPPTNQTWLFDGTGWMQGPAAPAGLAGRTGAEMVYDDALQRIVLFGGSGTLPYNDTWLYDGNTNTWTQGPLTPSSVSPRAFFGMAYDPVLQEIVIAGGDGGLDTWFFDGTTWAQGPDQPNPMGPRERFRAAYDPQLGGVTVFGGLGYAGKADLWVLVAGAWTNIVRPPTGWPDNRVDGCLVWNPDAGALMLFGGIESKRNGKVGYRDTWFFTGTPPAPATPMPPTAPPTLPAASTMPYDPPSGPADGVVSAHDNQFWLDQNPIILKGANDDVTSTGSEIQQLADYGMNMVRLRIHWAELEPNAPTKNQDGTWTHYWDATYLGDLDNYLQHSYQDGLWVVLDIHFCGARACGFFGPAPEWSYTAPYNSHGIDYPHTQTGKIQAQSDFWTDALRQFFYEEMWKELVTRYMNNPGIAGYEVMNEPQRGNLSKTHTTTQLMLDGQLAIAQTIRALDPGHTIFFSTRGDCGPGLRLADLSGWTDMGNVAFDIHEYFGGRWGVGLDLVNPGSPGYGEQLGSLFNHVATGTSTGNWPYIGTTYGAIRMFNDRLMNTLRQNGIPAWIGEIGDRAIDLGVFTYWGSATSAANYLGLSWSVDRGPFGFEDQPWEPLVLAAILAPG